jgi:hypothetical protein
MNDIEQEQPLRQSVVNGLAVAGFIALIVFGIWLAIYATRFVPSVVGGIGAAAVSLGSIFNPSPDSSLSVVPSGNTPTASTTISFGPNPTATTTATTSTPVATTPAPTSPKPKVPTTAGPQTTGTYPIGGSAPATLYGLPDLVVQIVAVGYLTTAASDSFTASTTVPNGNRPAVRFTIKNIGTNVTGAWRFSASIPTQSAYIYQSLPQQALGPGDSIDYVLGFDQANRGANQTISITANFDNAVAESVSNNNSAASSLTILGS